MSKMFPFITKTWNPLGGECQHTCSYCWARKLAAQYNMKKYIGQSRLIEDELRTQFQANDFVFVCDMVDLFGQWVDKTAIYKILTTIQLSTLGAKFLLLTKNPANTHYWINYLAEWNTVVGITLETNLDYVVETQAPQPSERFNVFRNFSVGRKGQKFTRFVSVEPILDFTLPEFGNMLISLKPWAVAIGYDNYSNGLPEPPLEKTLKLITRLEEAGITVYRKTLREPKVQ